MKDNARIKQLASTGKMDMDLFTCVKMGWHGFVLCPVRQAKTRMVSSSLRIDVVQSPFDISSQTVLAIRAALLERTAVLVQGKQRTPAFQQRQGKNSARFYTGDAHIKVTGYLPAILKLRTSV